MRGLLLCTDYMGMRADEKLYVLLNTGRTDAVFVEQRSGYKDGYPVSDCGDRQWTDISG
ncbi:hypothetical protein [Eubacterium ramulus]|uniref:hypothetical protein n=1 Tax=Eubacterium ramulus TaxID=39490 RepID=UPI00300F24EF